MTWNFRLVKHTDRRPRRVWYGVHEVFYNESGKPWTMTKDPIRLDGDSTKDVFAYLEMIRRDLKRMSLLDARKTKWARLSYGIRKGRTKNFKSLKEFTAELRG